MSEETILVLLAFGGLMVLVALLLYWSRPRPISTHVIIERDQAGRIVGIIEKQSYVG